MSKISELFEQAMRHFRAGRLKVAAELCEQIVAADPVHAFALDLLGQSALQSGSADQAEALFARAAELRPDAAAIHLNHGVALRRLNRPEPALAAMERARAIDSRSAEIHLQLGNLQKSLGRYPEAVESLSTAARLQPKQAAIWLNLGAAQLESGAAETAVGSFKRALKLEPTRPEAHNILGHALHLGGKSAPAEASFREALRLNSQFAPAHDNLGRLYRTVGRISESIAHYRAALAVQASPHTHSNLLFAMNFHPGLQPEDVFAEHRRWHEIYAAPLAAPRPSNRIREAGNRLRVGYLSPDFAHHAVSYFIEPVLRNHDRSRIEVFCYASVAQPDRVTERLRSHSEHWRDIAHLDDDLAAEVIRQDRLDLLVDIAGHTARHRLLVLARRPAPIQVTWIGYPNTTGLDAIDYRISDAISDPPGTTEAFHSEKLVRLPGPFSCYRPDDDAPAVNALPAAGGAPFTFASLNQFAKVTPEVIALWARVLQSVPSSRLLLKAPGKRDTGAASHICTAFAEAGIAGDRLILHGERLPTAAHLALYHQVDIALDPFPYNGTTTTCEALWMGVPVITLAGRTHAARVGASLLTHAGLPEWIVPDTAAYVARAAATAQDLTNLAALRATLREQMRQSPLCDAPRFVRALEDASYAMALSQN